MPELPQKYRNQALNVDVMEVLKDLPDNCIDMIYSDPDYNVGVKYAGGKTHTKNWNEYIGWYSDLIGESMRVLAPRGNLFTINYPRQNAHLWVKCLDEIAYDVREYVWVYNTNVGHAKRRFTTAHRSILHVTKSGENKFFKDNVAQPYQNRDDVRIKKRLAGGSKGRMPYSWFYYNLVKNVSKDKTFHSCQIPAELTAMLIRASTERGDTVFVLFGGSGSEILLAKSAGRNYLSCEINEEYHAMIKDRLRNNGAIRSEHKCLRPKQDQSLP